MRRTQALILWVVATPTNDDPDTNRFDTMAVDTVVMQATALAEDALVVIKSTVPWAIPKGSASMRYRKNRLFARILREGQALYDNLNPSRIIMGCSEELGAGFASLLLDAAEKTDVETLLMPSTEAEAVKLFISLPCNAGSRSSTNSTPTQWMWGWIQRKLSTACV